MFQLIVLFCTSKIIILSLLISNTYDILVISYVNSVTIHFKLRQLPRFYTPLNDKIYLASSFNQWRSNDKQFEFNHITNSLIVDFKNTKYIEFKITRGSWSTTETWNDGTMRENRKLTLVVNYRRRNKKIRDIYTMSQSV